MLLITSLQLHSQLIGYHVPSPRVTDGNNRAELKNVSYIRSISLPHVITINMKL